ncbi:MAG: hypothetical protein JXJ30_10840 [Halothiobacillaceae bacterium]|nr:hypothetical protein [Halothiobacillaceae bacterium]
MTRLPTALSAQALSAQALCEALPHAGGVCQIEQVIACDAERIVCRTTAHRRPDNPLRRDGRLSVHAGMEMAGQAMALHMALSVALSGDGKAAFRQGMITRLNDVRWSTPRLDSIEEPLIISVHCEVIAGGMARYAFSVARQADGSDRAITDDSACKGDGRRQEATLIEGRASVWLAPEA